MDIIPTITLAFKNPRTNTAGTKFIVDVMAKSDIPGQRIFGINMRYFYSALQLKSSSASVVFKEFAPGYGMAPFSKVTPIKGSATSGSLFGINGAAVYINTAVQSMSPSEDVYLDDWKKIFTIESTFNYPTLDPDPCAYMIWDKEFDPTRGGFLPGSAGTVVTVRAAPGTVNQNNIPMESAPALVKFEHLNWQYAGDVLKPPFGSPTC